MMESLPDEIWAQILSNSTKRQGGLVARDLCSLAVVSKRARRISGEGKVWRPLLERDFSADKHMPGEGSAIDLKALYMIKYFNRKAKREAERRRQIMRLESSVCTCELRTLKYKKTLIQEKAAAAEIRQQLSASHHSSRASLSLQRWQPDAVSTHHQRVVQQVPVDHAAHVNTLKLDLEERHHYIGTCENVLKNCEHSLKVYRQKLEELYYSPLIPINQAEDPLSPKSVILRSLVDCLSWRKAKRAKKSHWTIN